jgi:hypothetical protein
MALAAIRFPAMWLLGPDGGQHHPYWDEFTIDGESRGLARPR